MKKTIITSCILATMVVGGFALAQQVPSPTPTEINLKVDAKEIELIGKGLSTLPYGEVAPLMSKLQTQINAQMKPVAPKVEPKSEGK